MGAIGRELVRLSEERVIALERALDSREWRPGDPLRAKLEKDLRDARTELHFKNAMLRDDEATHNH